MSEKKKQVVFWTRSDSQNFFKNSVEINSGPESDGLYYYLAQNHDSLLDTVPPRQKPPEKLLKVIIIGDPTVGKTSFIQRYVQNTFSKEYKGTVGVDFALKVVYWHDSQVIKLQLWDIAGQERFTWMTRVYYKDAHGCIIMFDLTNKNSFENTLKWKKDLDSKCTLADGNPVPCMLLANKCDLPNRKVNQAEIEAFHKENNFIGWTETSAKDGLMVNDSMRFLIEIMLQQEGNSGIDQLSSKINLQPNEQSSGKSCFC